MLGQIAFLQVFCLTSAVAIVINRQDSLRANVSAHHRVEHKVAFRTDFYHASHAEHGYDSVVEMALGVTNRFGVTRYNSRHIDTFNSTSGLYWPDSSSRYGSQYAGAVDLTDNVSWGWHHPNGVYNTIPVGAPLIDDQMNIYLATDDAIRKFSAGGDLLWSYAPRGQIASAPALSTGAVGAARKAEREVAVDDMEADLKPAWRSGAAAPMLIGSTTSGFVFAISLENGQEVWATEASAQIAGVKGAVGVKDGVVLVATDRCVDRYCYRYRNQTNPLSPSNRVVRALNLADGTSLWAFKPYSPVWNFVPQFGKNDTVYFSDMEGSAYALNSKTGEVLWRNEGYIGTYTQASAVYDDKHDVVISLGELMYKHKYCNPYPSPGILPHCGSFPHFSRGFVRGVSPKTGAKIWEVELDEVPASAGLGMVKGKNAAKWQRLIVTTGKNCMFNSPTRLYAFDSKNGHIRWWQDGPTLWTSECAGDFEGGDVRRAMGSRSICEPNSWSTPVVDSNGDIFVGNQVGELQKWSSPTGGNRDWTVSSTLNTRVAFQDHSISFAPGIMAVATCNSLIVLQTTEGGFSPESWPDTY